MTAYRPLLRTRLISASGQTLDCIAIADTGADHCVFPLTFVATLGLDPLQMPMDVTGGVGNAANTTYYADITIEIFTTDTTPPIRFATLVGFTAGMDAMGCGLLGQTGFFASFPVIFNHPARNFTIEIPDPPQNPQP